MSNLKDIEQLRDLEMRREVLQSNLKAIRSRYFTGCSIRVLIATEDFNDKGDCTSIPYSKDNVEELLQKELDNVEKKSHQIILNLHSSIQ